MLLNPSLILISFLIFFQMTRGTLCHSAAFCPTCNRCFSSQTAHGMMNGHSLQQIRLCVPCKLIGSVGQMRKCRQHHQEDTLTMAEMDHNFSAILAGHDFNALGLPYRK